MLKRTPLYLAITAVAATMSQPVLAQDDGERIIEEVITIGTRSTKPRSAMDSAVPVDVFSNEDFNATGNSADVTDNLRMLVPSYTATPATGDGSAFVRPTSLRGMASDQTLILVNGKRRHRSSLVHFFAPAAGNGAHAVDVGMIPGIGVKSVEVLRDGAAAQYGSDAIAGVINFQMKDAAEGGEVLVQYGEYFDDEASTKIAGNGGFALGDKGFINATFEYVDNDALSRGNQRPDAQGYIDDGVEGIGADTPFDDEPFAQTWGRPKTEAIRIFINTGFDISDTSRIYAFGNYAETEGTYRFFYRNQGHSSLASLVDDHGYDGDLLNTGYTPHLDGEQKDYSLTAGIKGEIGTASTYDFSIGTGKNELDYFLNNSTNHSLGLDANGDPAQREFDVGGYEQEELTVNLDFTTELSDNLFLGVGGEYREETYTIGAGEEASWIGAGSNGLNGFRPADSGDFDRDNYALYGDLEWDVTEAVMLQGALRYEDYSDFGNTTIGKLAGRWSISDNFTLRAAASTGFHAPTPGQANIRTTITTFDGATGLQIEEGLVPPTSPIAVANGGTDLTEEKSVSYSVGFTSNFGENTSLTVDAYQTEVEDRIYRTGDIPVLGLESSSISFYTNALDVEHKGLDIVLSTGWNWGESSANTDLSFAFNHNETEVTDQKLVNSPVLGPVTPVSDSNVEDIENNYPEDRFVLTANTYFADNWNFLIRANYYGEHYDERGTIDDPDSPSAKISELMLVDLELGWDITDNWRVVAGASNVFDEYPDEIGEENANRISVGLPYPRRSAANYEGGSWYMRASYRW